MPFWQRTEGVRANNKRAVLVVYSKESPCLLLCTIALPKKSSVEPDAPTTARERRCILRDAVLLWQAIRRGAGGERKAPACVAARQLRRRGILAGGLTRRLRRGLGLAVPWGAHTFLSVAKEKCAKESQRHGDSGKKPFIAHFGGGARYVARSTVGLPTFTFVRARSSPFSVIKMGGPFSLRCLSPLCSPAVGGGHTHPLRVGMFRCGRKVLRRG